MSEAVARLASSARLGWMAQFAAQHGLRYEAEADERWLRAWEPYATLKTPVAYEHGLHATGENGSISVARLVVSTAYATPAGEVREGNVATWVVLAQDVRVVSAAAATNASGGPFGEPLDLVTLPRGSTGDSAFDARFAAFADDPRQVRERVSPSLRKLVMGWGVPLHFELRPGAFVVAPVALGADARSLAWLLDAVRIFGDKAVKKRVS